MRVLRWLGKALLGILVLLLVISIGFYAADPAVMRRLITGPPMGVVDQTDRNQPQEAVPGIEATIPAAPQATIEPAALAAAEDYATATQSVALLVWHRGALRYEKYWPGYDRDTRTDPFSAHKSVMALLMGVAIGDGVIESVDEPAANYLPEWRNDSRREITIRDLLQMSSGLEIVPFGSWRGMRLTLGSDLTEVALSVPAERPHGSEFQYLNLNSQLLGTILQRASGKRYAEFLSERLWTRIGAPTAYVWLDREGGMPRTFCCLYTTARGWLQVGLLLKNQGRFGDDQVVPAQWIADMTTPATTNANYGYQVWLGSPPGKERRYNDKTVKAYHSEPFAADDVIFIDGFGGQRVYVVPSQDLVIVRTGRVVADLSIMENNWDDARIPNAVLRGISHEPTAAANTN